MQHAVETGDKPGAKDEAPLFLADVRELDQVGSGLALTLSGALKVDAERVLDCEALVDQLKGDREAQAVVIYDSARTVLCRALQQNADLSAALAAWVERMQQNLLPVLRISRGRLALIEGRNLQASPAEVLERGYGYLDRSNPEVDLALQIETQDPVHQLIADRVLDSFTRAATLDGELEAQAVSRTILGGGNPAGQAAQAYADLAAGHQRSLTAKNQLTQELDGLQTELRQLRQAENLAEDTAAQSKSQVGLLKAQLQMLQNTLENQEGSVAALEIERVEKRSRGRTIEGLRKRVLGLEAEKADRDARLAERDAWLIEKDVLLTERDAWLAEKDFELNALWTSTSWRVTGPLRRLKLALSRRREN